MALKIPSTLDERNILHFAPREAGRAQQQPDIELDSLVATVRSAREEMTRLADLEAAIQADRTLTPEASALQVADAALRSADRVAPKLDAARSRAMAAIAGIDKATAAPSAPRDAVALGLETEIRAALAAMPENKRNETIAKALADRDLSVIGAVLRGPAFLAGVGSARQEVLRAQYRQAFHAPEHERRTRLTKALEAFERAGGAFVGTIALAADSQTVRLAASGKLRREEALARHQQEI